jgi:hypothetical protein
MSIQHLNNCIIDGVGTWGCLLTDTFNILWGFCEVIDDKGFVTTVDLSNALVKGVVGEDGEDRPKDLLLHQSWVAFGLPDDGWRDELFFFVYFPTVDDLTTVVIVEQLL